MTLIPWYYGLKTVLRLSGGIETAGVRLMKITAIISPYSAGIENGPMRPLFQTATSSHRNSVRSVRGFVQMAVYINGHNNLMAD